MTTRIARVYDRVVLKISGESLGVDETLDRKRFQDVAEDIADLHEMGIAVVVVVGGGNIFRGSQGGLWSLDEPDADSVGMVATGINVLLLSGVCQSLGLEVEIFSRGPCAGFGAAWDRHEVDSALLRGRTVMLAGGMGIPGVSTDVPAVHVAVDIGAQAVIFAKNGVGGVCEADPRLSPDARILQTVSASRVLQERLGVMDMTAVQFALDHNKCLHVIPANERGVVRRVASGIKVGSVILPH